MHRSTDNDDACTAEGRPVLSAATKHVRNVSGTRGRGRPGSGVDYAADGGTQGREAWCKR